VNARTGGALGGLSAVRETTRGPAWPSGEARGGCARGREGVHLWTEIWQVRLGAIKAYCLLLFLAGLNACLNVCDARAGWLGAVPGVSGKALGGRGSRKAAAYRISCYRIRWPVGPRRPERHGELGGILISIPRPLGRALYRSGAGRASFRPPFC